MLEVQFAYGNIKENTLTRKIEVNICGQQYAVCITELAMLRRRLNAINFETFFFETSPVYDTFKLTLPRHKLVQSLTVPQAIALKEAINTIFYLFELHAVLVRNRITYAADALEPVAV